MGQDVDLVAGQGLAEGWHIAAPALGDGLLDLFEAAAVDPVVIGQVGKEPHFALAAGLVTGRAVVGEQGLARRHHEAGQLGILGDLLEGQAGDLVEVGLLGGGGLLGFGQELGPGIPVPRLFLALGVHVGHRVDAGQEAFAYGPRGVDHPVDQRKEDGHIEGVGPPRRQGIVEFLKVAVPHVAGGLWAR